MTISWIPINRIPRTTWRKCRTRGPALSSDLANYRSSTLDEEVLVKRLGDLLNQHWQYISRAMSSPSAGSVRRILLQ